MQMRKRRDLLASIGEEIDNLIGTPAATFSPLAPPEVHPAPSPAAQTRTSDSSARTSLDVPSVRDRLVGMRDAAIVGAVVGGVSAILNDNIGPGASNTPVKDFFFCASMTAFFAAFTGAVAARRWKVIRVALVGAAPMCLTFTYSCRRVSDFIMLLGTVGAPLGAILGAVVGIKLLKQAPVSADK